MATESDSEFMLPTYRALPVKGLGLGEKTLDKIWRENYVRRVGEPRPVDTEKVLSAAERLLCDIENVDDQKMQETAALVRQLLSKM